MVDAYKTSGSCHLNANISYKIYFNGKGEVEYVIYSVTSGTQQVGIENALLEFAKTYKFPDCVGEKFSVKGAIYSDLATK